MRSKHLTHDTKVVSFPWFFAKWKLSHSLPFIYFLFLVFIFFLFFEFCRLHDIYFLRKYISQINEETGKEKKEINCLCMRLRVWQIWRKLIARHNVQLLGEIRIAWKCDIFFLLFIAQKGFAFTYSHTHTYTRVATQLCIFVCVLFLSYDDISFSSVTENVMIESEHELFKDNRITTSNSFISWIAFGTRAPKIVVWLRQIFYSFRNAKKWLAFPRRFRFISEIYIQHHQIMSNERRKNRVKKNIFIELNELK